MSRAFLICPEPVRQLTAGVGSRLLTLARVLVAAGHRVTLAVPNDPAEAGLAEPGLELVQIVGCDPSPRDHQLRDVLSRNGIPHGYYLADSDAGRRPTWLSPRKQCMAKR